MDKFNIAVLVDAKQEYTHQLIQLLYPQIYIGIKSIYDGAKEFCQKSNDNNILKKFQQLLSNVPKWNTDRIDEEFKRIQKNTECDWIEDLITAVFVSHTKVLTAIQLKNNNKKTIQLSVPQGSLFVHKCYTEVARAFWKRPYLFNHQLSNIDLQRNLADAEQVIKDAIQETVRRMLPVRHILKEYLGNDYKDDDLNEDDITSHLSLNTKNNLRKLVQQEIEQTLSKKDEDFIENEVTKQIELPSTKKQQLSKNETLQITKIDDSNQLEQELIDAINENHQQSTGGSSENIDMTIEKEEPINLEQNITDDIKNDITDDIKEDVKEEIKEDVKEEIKEDNKIGLVDIFDIKSDNNTPSKTVLDVKPVEPNYDIFSFFEDAAPYER